MGFREALESKIGELEAKRGIDPNFDTWNSEEIEYLKKVLVDFGKSGDVGAICRQLKGELPTLHEEALEAEFAPRFDWYDDHYYEKIACGRESACKMAIRLCEQYL